MDIMDHELKKCVILVHPSMSVNLIFQVIRQYPYKIFSIITGLEAGRINSQYVEQNSDYHYFGSNQVEVDIADIKRIIHNNHLSVIAIVNGIDASLYYTDYLVTHLIDKNLLDLNYSKIRLNKYQVNQVLSNNNIVNIPSLELTPQFLEYEDFIKQHCTWPIVAKPSENTAAQAGFKILHNQQQLDSYLSNIFGSSNSYYKELTVEKVVLQQYISLKDYDEFVIDFVNYQGKHYLQNIVAYEKETTATDEIVYRKYRPLTLDEIPNISKVIDYVLSILEALHVEYGFTHNEVLWDRKDSFYLVESNNRMAGGGVLDTCFECYGYIPIQTLFDLIEARAVTNLPNQRFCHSICIHLYNFFPGEPTSIYLDGIKSFKSIMVFYPHIKTPPGFLNYTRADHITATLLLSTPDLEVLNADIQELLVREQAGSLFITEKPHG